MIYLDLLGRDNNVSGCHLSFFLDDNRELLKSNINEFGFDELETTTFENCSLFEDDNKEDYIGILVPWTEDNKSMFGELTTMLYFHYEVVFRLDRFETKQIDEVTEFFRVKYSIKINDETVLMIGETFEDVDEIVDTIIE